MMTSFYNLLKYAQTGIASPDMTYYDKLRASTLMGGVVQTLTGQPPLSFKADGSPLISWSMKGNGQQTGTPTPDAPIMPTFCGTLDNTDWKIPLTCAGQTVPVYLGQTQTVRRIKKLVLTGEESITKTLTISSCYYISVSDYLYESETKIAICTHYEVQTNVTGAAKMIDKRLSFYANQSNITRIMYIRDTSFATKEDLASYLAAQYAAGTPVTVWYVLAEPETAIVNEPLCKIGTYADELHSTDAGVSIPTAKGQNTLTVDTPIQPSEMTITFKG